MTYYLPIILMVLGTTVYHIAQKSVPAASQPALLADDELCQRATRHNPSYSVLPGQSDWPMDDPECELGQLLRWPVDRRGRTGCSARLPHGLED